MADPEQFPHNPSHSAIPHPNVSRQYAQAFGVGPTGTVGGQGFHAPTGDESPARVATFYSELARLTPRADITRLLVVVNVGIFIAMVAMGAGLFSPSTSTLIRWGANLGIQTTAGQWWRLFTCMFLHIGLIHLAMNMYVLWAVGPFVERLLGRTGFLLTYILGGLAGSLASVWRNPEVVSAGASGAIFGLFGALLGFVVFRRGSLPMQAVRGITRYVLVFVGLNVTLGLTQPHIDMAAHIGGLIGGFLCGVALSTPISPGLLGRRRVRNAILSMAGTASLVMLAASLPKGPAVADRLIREFAALRKSSQVTLDQFADPDTREKAALVRAINLQVLPQWQAFRLRVAAARLPDLRLKLLDQYIGAQDDAWSAWVRAVEAGPEVPSDIDDVLGKLQLRADEARRAYERALSGSSDGN